MIFYPQRNLLILKNFKVGGTSLEADLEKVLPSNCIVTEPEPSHIKVKGFAARNYKEYGFTSHASFNDFKQKLPDVAKKVTSVVFVRNPFDVVLSHFFMLLKINKIKQEDYKEYLNIYFSEDKQLPMLKSTKNIYSNNGKIQVSYVFKYENGIEKQINSVLSMVKAPNVILTSKEKDWKPKNLSAKEVFNKEQLGLIEKEWAWEIKNFYKGCL